MVYSLSVAVRWMILRRTHDDACFLLHWRFRSKNYSPFSHFLLRAWFATLWVAPTEKLKSDLPTDLVVRFCDLWGSGCYVFRLYPGHCLFLYPLHRPCTKNGKLFQHLVLSPGSGVLCSDNMDSTIPMLWKVMSPHVPILSTYTSDFSSCLSPETTCTPAMTSCSLWLSQQKNFSYHYRRSTPHKCPLGSYQKVRSLGCTYLFKYRRLTTPDSKVCIYHVLRLLGVRMKDLQQSKFMCIEDVVRNQWQC